MFVKTMFLILYARDEDEHEVIIGFPFTVNKAVTDIRDAVVLFVYTCLYYFPWYAPFSYYSTIMFT